MSVYKNQSKFEFRPTRKQYFEICTKSNFFTYWHDERKKIILNKGTSAAKWKKINRRCVTEKTCDAKRLHTARTMRRVQSDFGEVSFLFWPKGSLPSLRTYHKVASSNTSRLEAHACFFKLLMKGILILMYCDLLTKGWFPN